MSDEASGASQLQGNGRIIGGSCLLQHDGGDGLRRPDRLLMNVEANPLLAFALNLERARSSLGLRQGRPRLGPFQSILA